MNKGLTFIDRSQRNRNFEITGARGQSYFTKEARAGITTLGREAAIYRFIHEHDDAKDLLPYVPSLCDYDRARHLLVFRLIKRGRSLSDVLNARRRIGRRIAEELGRGIAAIHRVPASPRLGSTSTPWVLSLPQPRIEFVAEISSANLQLVRIVQESRTLCRGLDRLRRSWRSVSLIHNDLRFPNCVVSNPGQRRRALELKIVDWELAGAGEPSWDVGCVFC